MIKKKYYVNSAGYLCDMDLSNTLSIFECADRLNELTEENEELQEDLNDALNRIEERSIDVQLLKEENGNLKKENELKGDFRNFINEDIVRIKNENEQLKQKNMYFLKIMFALKNYVENEDYKQIEKAIDKIKKEMI